MKVTITAENGELVVRMGNKTLRYTKEFIIEKLTELEMAHVQMQQWLDLIENKVQTEGAQDVLRK